MVAQGDRPYLNKRVSAAVSSGSAAEGAAAAESLAGGCDVRKKRKSYETPTAVR